MARVAEDMLKDTIDFIEKVLALQCLRGEIIEIPVALLRWTQDSISGDMVFFHDEHGDVVSKGVRASMYKTLDQLIRRERHQNDLPPLEVVDEDGAL